MARSAALCALVTAACAVVAPSQQPTPLLELRELDPFESHGEPLASIRDANGDGHPELVIGAPGAGTFPQPGLVERVSAADAVVAWRGAARRDKKYKRTFEGGDSSGGPRYGASVGDARDRRRSVRRRQKYWLVSTHS